MRAARTTRRSQEGGETPENGTYNAALSGGAGRRRGGVALVRAMTKWVGEPSDLNACDSPLPPHVQEPPLMNFFPLAKFTVDSRNHLRK